MLNDRFLNDMSSCIPLCASVGRIDTIATRCFCFGASRHRRVSAREIVHILCCGLRQKCLAKRVEGGPIDSESQGELMDGLSEARSSTACPCRWFHECLVDADLAINSILVPPPPPHTHSPYYTHSPYLLRSPQARGATCIVTMVNHG